MGRGAGFTACGPALQRDPKAGCRQDCRPRGLAKISRISAALHERVLPQAGRSGRDRIGATLAISEPTCAEFQGCGNPAGGPGFFGVYGLSNAREWIHVGETDNIQGRLLEHLEGTDSFRAAGAPTGFSFELSPPQDRRRSPEPAYY